MFVLFSLLFFLFLASESYVYVMCIWCNVYISLLTLARPSCHAMLNWLYFYIFLTIFNQVFLGSLLALPLHHHIHPFPHPIFLPLDMTKSPQPVSLQDTANYLYAHPPTSLMLVSGPSYPSTLAQQSILCSLKRDSMHQIASEHLGEGSCNNQTQNSPGHVWPINLIVT